MSTVTIAPTVEASNLPPRIRLDITSTDATSTTLTRLNPDGTTSQVRTADGNPLPITSGSALAYDYEAPFGSSVSYSSVESPATVSAQVTVNADSVWLVHPGVPALSMPITVGKFGDRSTKVKRGVFYPMGRATPVVVTDGTRGAAEYDLTVVTLGDNERDDFTDLLSDASPLLLNVPVGKGFGVGAAYVAVGDVTEGRITRLGAEPARTWTLPCTVVDRPAGGSQSLRTYVDVLAGSATYAALQAEYPTYLSLLAGP